MFSVNKKRKSKNISSKKRSMKRGGSSHDITTIDFNTFFRYVTQIILKHRQIMELSMLQKSEIDFESLKRYIQAELDKHRQIMELSMQQESVIDFESLIRYIKAELDKYKYRQVLSKVKSRVTKSVSIFEKLYSLGNLDTLLLYKNTSFGKNVKDLFLEDKGLIFYRSVYVDHLIKIILVLKFIYDSKKVTGIKLFDFDFDEVIAYFIGVKSNLEYTEKIGKMEGNKPKYVLNTRNTIVDLSSVSFCQVLKILFSGVEYPNNETKIKYNGSEYDQQHYEDTDSNHDVKGKINNLLQFVIENDEEYFSENEKKLDNPKLRKKYIEHLKTKDCYLLISMLEFLDKSIDDARLMYRINDHSGVSSLEIPKIPDVIPQESAGGSKKLRRKRFTRKRTNKKRKNVKRK